MNSVFAIILCSFISRVRRFQQPQAIALSDSNEYNGDVSPATLNSNPQTFPDQRQRQSLTPQLNLHGAWEV